MTNVVNLDDYRGPWCAGPAACQLCGAEWVAVYPASVTALECGECGRMSGISLSPPRMTIENIGGNCPVQAEGYIDGQPFYFRARGEHWTLNIGGDPIGAPYWTFIDKWPGGQFAAGWMALDEALSCIAKGIAAYDKRGNDDQS